MGQTNHVFIATSLDGYIADRDGGLDWLQSVPNPDGDDMGYVAFMGRIDALVMGRASFETVLGFGIEWPYTKPVYVLSSTLKEVPPELSGKVEIVNGALSEVLEQVHAAGHQRLYIDGGRTVQNFLQEGLIDDLIITTIPVLLGGGVRLFGELPESIQLELVSSETLLGQIVQRHYRLTDTGKS